MTTMAWSCRGLDALDAALRQASTRRERSLIRLRKACLLARLTYVDEARATLNEVRAGHPAYDPQLSAWAMFCEGLIEHFDSLGGKAIGSFKRAQAVSISAGDRELAAITSAWIAASQLAAGDHGALPASLGQAFNFADESNASALARSNLVIADLLSVSGQIAESRPWYRLARDYAVQDGDISMQSVILFNDASYRVFDLVLQDCQGPVAERDAMLVGLAVDSIGNLDQGLGAKRLTSMVPLLRADVCTVHRRWDEAIGLFDAFLADRSVHVHLRLGPRYLAQRAYCKSMLDEHSPALADIEAALETSSSCRDMDDLYVLHTRAALVFQRAGRADRSSASQDAARRCKAAFDDTLLQLRETAASVIERTRTRARKSPA